MTIQAQGANQALGFCINLTVSFSLALYVVMKSRKVSFLQWRLLTAAVLKRLLQEPRQFFLPSRTQAVR